MAEERIEDQIEILTPTLIDAGDGKTVNVFLTDNPKSWDASHRGLRIQANPTYFDQYFPTEDGRVKIPKGAVVGKVDFIPNGMWEKDPKNTTHAMSVFLDAAITIIDFLDSTDENLEPPVFLKNLTNPEMASFIKRFGFREVVPRGKVPTGKIEVLVRTDEFKKKLKEFCETKKDFVEKLNNRSDRESKATEQATDI